MEGQVRFLLWILGIMQYDLDDCEKRHVKTENNRKINYYTVFDLKINYDILEETEVESVENWNEYYKSTGLISIPRIVNNRILWEDNKLYFVTSEKSCEEILQELGLKSAENKI